MAFTPTDKPKRPTSKPNSLQLLRIIADNTAESAKNSAYTARTVKAIKTFAILVVGILAILFLFALSYGLAS